MPSSDGVVEHTVLFKVKESATQSQINDMLSSISSLKTDPSILHLSIGPVRSVRHSTYTPRNHRPSSPSSCFTHMMHSRHTNKADVLVYYEDPVHMSIKDKVVPILDDFMAFDWVVRNDGIDGPATLPAGTAVKLQLLKVKVNEEEKRGDDRSPVNGSDDQVVEKEMGKLEEKEEVVVAPPTQPKREEKEVVNETKEKECNNEKKGDHDDEVMEIEFEGVKIQAKVVDVKVNNTNHTVPDDTPKAAVDVEVAEADAVEVIKVKGDDEPKDQTMITTTTITTPPPPPPSSATDKLMEVIGGMKGKVRGLKHLNYGENFMPELAKDFSVCLVGIFDGVEEMDKVEGIVNVDGIDCVDGSIVVDYVVVFHEPAPHH